MSVSGCGCVQWDVVFASRQLFLFSIFGFFAAFGDREQGEEKVKPYA